MRAMIFSAGLGTRLKPFTDSKPKALLPLAGKTLLQWQIERLQAAGIDDIVVNVHHFADQIVRYIEENDGFGSMVRISSEEEVLLDTGGGLLHARSLLGNDETVLACNVDILSNIDIQALVSNHRADDMATVVVSDRETQRYLLFDGMGELRGWTNRSTGAYRPQSAARQDLVPLAFSGMQIVTPSFFEQMEIVASEKAMCAGASVPRFSLIDAYLSVVERGAGTIRAYVPRDYRMMDVGKIEQLEQAEAFARSIG